MSGPARALLISFGPCDLRTWFGAVARVAEGVVQANVRWLGEHPHVTPEQLPIVYQPRDYQAINGELVWPCRTAEVIINDLRGNCLELACLLAATYRRAGKPAAAVEIATQGDGSAHAYVVLKGLGGPRRCLDPASIFPLRAGQESQ